MPRKIETEMNRAVSYNKNWQNGNTSVHYDEQNDVNEVYLHGNLIAKVGEDWMQIFDGGYQSNTTKSRLNALLSEHGCGEYVFQRNYQWFIQYNGAPIPFTSGLLLN